MPFSLRTKTSRTENNVVYSTTLLSMVKKVNLGMETYRKRDSHKWQKNE